MYDDSLEEVLLLFSFQSPNVTVAANYVQENDLDEEHFLAAGWIELKSKKVTYGSWTCRARYGDDKPLAGRDELLGRIAAALREKGIFPH